MHPTLRSLSSSTSPFKISIRKKNGGSFWKSFDCSVSLMVLSACGEPIYVMLGQPMGQFVAFWWEGVLSIVASEKLLSCKSKKWQTIWGCIIIIYSAGGAHIIKWPPTYPVLLLTRKRSYGRTHSIGALIMYPVVANEKQVCSWLEKEIGLIRPKALTLRACHCSQWETA